MRATAYLLIIFALLLAAKAGYDEARGGTYKPYTIIPYDAATLRESRHSYYLYQIPFHKDLNPLVFHRFMRVHWIYAGIVAGAGILLLLKSFERPSFP